MATIKIFYRSKKDKAPLILKLRYTIDGKSYTTDAPVEITVEKSYWENVHFEDVEDVDVFNKQSEIKTKIIGIKSHVKQAVASEKVEFLCKEWLVRQIDLYYKPEEVDEVSEYASDCIQQIVDDAPYRENAKGGIGLSISRVNSYKQLKLHFNKFQGAKNYKVLDLNKRVFDEFKKYLLGTKKFAATYAIKKLADLKTVCNDAEARGIPVSTDLKGVKTKQVSPYDDDMDVIALTIEEVEKIEGLDLKSKALINARKWLIVGVFTGQRGEMLTERVVKKNFYKYGKGYEIRAIQKKGNKNVRIPVLPRVKKLYEEDSLPYPISTQKLRKYFKEIGKLAELNEMIMGRVIEAVGEGKNKERRGIKKLRPKHEYIGLHTLRRSFACIHDGKMPREVIMKVTGHTKIETYLKYVNKDRNEHLDAFLDYYMKEEQKAQKESQLSVVGKKTKVKKAL